MKTIFLKGLKLTGFLVLAGFILSSCATTAHIEKDDSVDFRKYKKYAWIDRDGSGINDRNRKNDLEEKRVREAVNQELKKQGWTETKSRPDVYLAYDVLVENTTRVKQEPVYSQSFIRTYYNPYTRRWVNVYYPSRFLGYDAYNESVKEGTLTITMIDAKTDRTVWQGWTTGTVNTRNLTSKEIQSAVKSIFRKFDVAKR
jgi:hypothetical protein